MKSARLSKLLTSIQKKLVSHVPEAVRKQKIESPAYCLFIWYQDSSTDEYTPQYFVAPVGLRDACLAEKDLSKIGGDALDAVWRPQQTIRFPYQGFRFSINPCENVSAESNECYSILLAEESSEEDGDEGAVLMPFRTALHKAARELNGLDWSGILPRSDDFIVLATDYIGYWLAEDMAASVSKKQLSILESHGFLLKNDPKAAEAAYEAEQAAAIVRELEKPGMVRCANTKCGKAVPKEARRCPHCQGPGPSY